MAQKMIITRSVVHTKYKRADKTLVFVPATFFVFNEIQISKKTSRNM